MKILPTGLLPGVKLEFTKILLVAYDRAEIGIPKQIHQDSTTDSYPDEKLRISPRFLYWAAVVVEMTELARFAIVNVSQ